LTAALLTTTVGRLARRRRKVRPMDDLAVLLENAGRSRRLARAITETDPAVKSLLALAEGFEAKAASLTAETDVAIPSPK
jgi:hypothetical protein